MAVDDNSDLGTHGTLEDNDPVEGMEIGRGAEAVLTLEDGVVRKWRLPKSYRVRPLDEKIRQDRTISEARLISEARRLGVPTPLILDISPFELVMEEVKGTKLKEVVDEGLCELVGETVGKLHSGGIIHGDLTTSNMIIRHGKIYLIDFGLALHDTSLESQGVDVHVFFQTLRSTHDQAECLVEAFKRGYSRTNIKAPAVFKRVEEIRSRGRYL